MPLHQDTYRGKWLDGAPDWIATLDLLGGRLCLDFVNTVDSREGGSLRDDFFSTYSDLVYWGCVVGFLTEGQVARFLRAAEARPSEASSIFEQAFTLREILYRVFAAVARATVPLKTDLKALREAYAQAIGHADLLPTNERFVWHWPRDDEQDLACMLWPVIQSAIELLTSQDLKRVKECPGAGDCGWLFLDTSKNGSRVWCSMESCGSRVKTRRQYARKRSGPVQEETS